MGDTKEREPGSGRLARLLNATTLGYFAGLSVMVGAYGTGDLSLLGDFSQAPFLLLGLILGGFVFPLLPLLTRQRRPVFALLWSVAGIALTIGAGIWNYLNPVTTNLEFAARGFLSAGLVLWIAALWGFLSTARWVPVTPTGRRMWLSCGVGTAVMVLSASAIYILQNYAYFPVTVLLFEVGGGALLAMLLLAFRALPPAIPKEAPQRVRAPPQNRSRGIAPVLLAIVLCAGPGLAVWANSFPVTAAGPSPSFAGASPPTKTPIHHVVMIMLENHAFDNLFGTYPSDPATAGNGIAANLTRPLNLLSLPSIPSFLTPVPNSTFTMGGPIEGYSAYHLDVNGGKMNGFLQNSGPAAVTYATSAQMAPEWDWAEEYGLGDQYFAPMLTETNPNRLYSLCGFSPVINDYGPPPFVPYDQCIFSELAAHNVSFGYYVQDPSAGIGTLNYLTGVTPSTPWVGTYSKFFSQVAAGTLPEATWMEPVDGGVGASYDQLPDTLTGTMWLLKVVDSLMQSPEWNSTAIFVTYDEGGGFYDQVAPPTLDGEPLGQRLPFLVISPYAKEDYVSHTLLNHCSQLAFLDYNWGLPALNSFTAASNLPLDFFDFSAPPRSPVVFTAAQGFPVPATIPFGSGPSGVSSLAPLFPQPLQIPLQNLTYARQGQTNETLQGLGVGVYVTTNYGVIPFEQSIYLVLLVFDFELAVIPFGILAVHRSRRVRPTEPTT